MNNIVSYKLHSGKLFDLYLYTDISTGKMAGCAWNVIGKEINRTDNQWKAVEKAWKSLPDQLSEYFSGKRREFEIPEAQLGCMTGHQGFTSAVLKALYQIPFGSTRTYSELAEMAGSPKAYRAAANAVATNPYPVIIPCHRILPKSGGLGNYALRSLGDKGIPIKAYLLKQEEVLT